MKPITIEQWTMHFLDRGLSLIDAKKRAIEKFNFLKECEELKPSQNKVDTAMYRK